jgi:hypothetical protein
MRKIYEKLEKRAGPKYAMTTCGKTGIKIRDTGNGYKEDPFANVDPFAGRVREPERVETNYNKTSYETIDLNIENYSRGDLYKLFGFRTNASLTEENMKDAKKVVLKTHPDKSHLENKYFLFFSAAYKRLYEIYEFQNKMNTKKQADKSEYYDSQNGQILDKMFEMKKDMKKPENFNKWFNDQFEKHRIEDPVENGYGNWLKSEEDIVYTPQNINKDSMAREMDKRKREIRELTPYSGVNDPFSSSSFGGSQLMAYDSNYTSGSLFSGGGGGGMGYTDLRQAYVESVIPVTEEDYNKTQKFGSVDEYRRHRDTNIGTPMSKEEAMRQLFNENKQKDEESAALAFYYAQQSEKAKQSQSNFWSGLKQLTDR